MLSLRAEALSHKYNGQTALRQVSLEIAGGERFAIVGPNGAGKSTLLRLLTLLEKPFQGEVHYATEGKPAAHDLGLHRRLGLVLQHPLLFHTTVLGNVLYGLEVRQSDRKTARGKALQALEQVGLSHLANRWGQALSGGEAQLVSLARVLVLEPEVLFLDEVTSHLDPANEAKVEQILLQLNQTRKTTLVLVTQRLAQAARLASRGLVLFEGEPVESGPLPQLLRQPQHPRTRKFVQGQIIGGG